MNNYKEIDIENWKHKHSFEFFQSFDCPLVNVTFDFDVSKLFSYCKENDESFFLMTLYAFLKSINLLPEFRQRILEDGKVVEFDKIATLSPFLIDEEECRLALFEYFDKYKEFKAYAEPIINASKAGDLEATKYDYTRQDIICASCMPWFSFTSMIHAKMSFKTKTYPVLSWGKMREDGKVALSMQFDHSFIDGIHLAKFSKAVEAFLSTPETL